MVAGRSGSIASPWQKTWFSAVIVTPDGVMFRQGALDGSWQLAAGCRLQEAAPAGGRRQTLLGGVIPPQAVSAARTAGAAREFRLIVALDRGRRPPPRRIAIAASELHVIIALLQFMMWPFGRRPPECR